jgi:ABC-type dipeptide/oligopeptide/nickel transport system permease component
MRMTLGVLQRLAGFVLVFLGVTFIIYVAVFSLPGDPIRALAGDRQLPQSVVDAINAKYLLDQPLWVQTSVSTSPGGRWRTSWQPGGPSPSRWP